MSLSTITTLQATLVAVISCLIWSSAILVMNLLGAAFGPITGAALEVGIAGLLLAGRGWLRGDLIRIALHSRRCLLICGAFWILNLTLTWLAVSLVLSEGELLVTGLLNYLWPSLTLLFSIPLLGKRANWRLLWGLLAVFSGIVLAKVTTTDEVVVLDALTQLNPWAYSLAVLDAIAWALYSNFSRRLSNPDGASAVPLYMLIGSCMLFFASHFSEEYSNPSFFDYLLLVVWSGAAALAYTFWDVGMRFGNVVAISTTSMLILLLSTIITAVLSGHGLTLPLVGAAALVVVGSKVCSRGVVESS